MKYILSHIFSLFLVMVGVTYGTSDGFIDFTIQEIRSPNGPYHSDGIVYTNVTGSLLTGTTVGLVYFQNDLVLPKFGGKVGSRAAGIQTGHCAQTSIDALACYILFTVTRSSIGKGRITFEAYFPLAQFPLAEFVITGGTGDFLGIVGSGVTSIPPDDTSGLRLNYDFKVKFATLST